MFCSERHTAPFTRKIYEESLLTTAPRDSFVVTEASPWHIGMYGFCVKNVYAWGLKGRGTLEKDSLIIKKLGFSVGCRRAWYWVRN